MLKLKSESQPQLKNPRVLSDKYQKYSVKDKPVLDKNTPVHEPKPQTKRSVKKQRNVSSDGGSVDSRSSRKVQLRPPKRKKVTKHGSAKRLSETDANAMKQTCRHDTMSQDREASKALTPPLHKKSEDKLIGMTFSQGGSSLISHRLQRLSIGDDQVFEEQKKFQTLPKLTTEQTSTTKLPKR